MTSNELIALVRKKVKDANSVTWTAAQVLEALNSAYRLVARKLARHSKVNYTVGTETITTTGAGRYALSATDIRRIFNMRRTDVDEKCRQINELDRQNYTGMFSDAAEWLYFVTRSVAATPVYTINFLDAEEGSGKTFVVQYIARPADLAADNNTPTYVDEDFHELIALEAAATLLGPDNSMSDAIRAEKAELWQDALTEVPIMANAEYIRDEF